MIYRILTLRMTSEADSNRLLTDFSYGKWFFTWSFIDHFWELLSIIFESSIYFIRGKKLWIWNFRASSSTKQSRPLCRYQDKLDFILCDMIIKARLRSTTVWVESTASAPSDVGHTNLVRTWRKVLQFNADVSEIKSEDIVDARRPSPLWLKSWRQNGIFLIGLWDYFRCARRGRG